jgi:hypothetical protein
VDEDHTPLLRAYCLRRYVLGAGPVRGHALLAPQVEQLMLTTLDYVVFTIWCLCGIAAGYWLWKHWP